MTPAAPIVIVGAGQAGLQVAESLRAEGHGGEILLLGDEAAPPYHRPPLSKALLAGEAEADQIAIRSPEVLARKGIQWRSGAVVTALDRDGRRLVLADGSSLAYAGLALATGARLRPLSAPGAELEGVFGLRQLDDALRLKAGLGKARRAAVIGGGFIGLETAAQLRKQGLAVTVIEAADRLMARVASPLVAGVFAELHRQHGVELRLGTQVTALRGKDGRVVAVETAAGGEIAADLVVVGIGVLPNDDLARACGLDCGPGIIVDDCGRTTHPGIVAAGDCTARRSAPGAPLIRLESVQNAVEQAKSAAAALLGRDRPFTATPWFWSDQYDAKLQMVGSQAGHDHVALRGDPASRCFSAFYFREQALIGVDSLNRPQDHLAARKLMDRRVRLSPEQAADEAVSLGVLL